MRNNTRRKPRGTIDREYIGYLGERARGGNVLRYTVSGRGTFPVDMLRYDSAQALAPVEVETPTELATFAAVRQVRIVNAHGCTPARWSSFGWSVHNDIEEYAP